MFINIKSPSYYWIYVMSQSQDPQQQLEQALEKQQQNSKQLDRILWIALPIFALMLSTLFANWNIASTIGTAFVLTIAFISVGIKKKSLAITLSITLIYCLIDNYLSYGMQFNIGGLKRQLLSMILFITIVGLSRSFAERSMMNIK